MEENGVFDGDVWRTLCAEEREIRLGFPAGHTEAAWSKHARRASPRDFEDLRCALVGQSIATPVVATLLSGLLISLKVLTRLPSVEECWGSASAEAKAELERRLRLEEASIDYEVVAHLHRNASYKGADLRLGVGKIAHPNRWPRESVPVKRWDWSIGGSFPLSGQHQCPGASSHLSYVPLEDFQGREHPHSHITHR